MHTYLYFIHLRDLNNTNDHSSETRTLYLVKRSTGTFEGKIVTTLEKKEPQALKKLGDKTERSPGLLSQSNAQQ